MAKRSVSFTSVISNRGFRFLWFNQILVQLAYNTINFALIIWVFKLTNSNLAVSALILSIYLPSFIFGLLAGVYIDVADRRKIILWIDGLLAIGFFSFIFIKESYPLILLNSFFINSLSQFFMPVESSSIPLLINRKKLLTANSLFSMTLYGSFMVGYSLAGPILSFFGINTLFVFGTSLLVLAWVLSQNLPVIQISQKRRLQALSAFTNFRRLTIFALSEIRLTLNVIKGKLSVVSAIGILAAVQGVIGILAVLISPYMEKVLRIHATDSSYVLMLPLGLGMVTGAFSIGRFATRFPKRFLIIPAITLVGILFVLMGIIPVVGELMEGTDFTSRLIRPRFFFHVPSVSLIFVLGAFAMGIFTALIIIPAQTVLQESTHEAIRAKVSSALVVLMNLFAAIPVILTGALADLLGVIPIFITMGTLIFLVGLMASRPAIFFTEDHLPFKLREFLGLGHWEKG
ncbi:MAG: MFS transporter [Candidatus Daviesbacteria bacterium]|nr:MAG: MFS transporter [Candidatus Daviesbacteria bacterium]